MHNRIQNLNPISAEEAYQKSLDFFDAKKYLESQAWLAYAIKLKHTPAEIAFCSQGMAKPYHLLSIENHLHHWNNPNFKIPEISFFARMADLFEPEKSVYLRALNLAILVFLSLSNRKLECILNARVILKQAEFSFENKSYVSHWMDVNDFCKIQMANKTKLAKDALVNPDTHLCELAKIALTAAPNLFFEFMSYCVKSNLLSQEDFQLVLTFIQLHGSNKSKNRLIPKGSQILSDLNPTQNSISYLPQSSTTNMMQVLASQPVVYITAEAAQSPVYVSASAPDQTVNPSVGSPPPYVYPSVSSYPGGYILFPQPPSYPVATSSVESNSSMQPIYLGTNV